VGATANKPLDRIPRSAVTPPFQVIIGAFLGIGQLHVRQAGHCQNSLLTVTLFTANVAS